MRVAGRIFLFLLFFLLFSYAGAHENAVSDQAIIHMDETGFDPSSTNIMQGSTVIFENIGSVEFWPASNIHPTHEIYSEFDSKRPILPGESWEFTFEKPGLWQFHDHLNPKHGGKIIVDIRETAEPEVKIIAEKNFRQSILSFFKNIRNWFAGLFGKQQNLADNKTVENRIFSAVPMPPQTEPDITSDMSDRPGSFVAEYISIDSSEIFHDYQKLYSYIAKFKPAQTLTRLQELETQYGSCHETAHYVGRFSYELYGTESFKLCGMPCQSGCYHGAVEAFFKEKGTLNLAENLRGLCSEDLNPFVKHQCLHGMGHGLMAWTNYELFDALEGCDLLNARYDQTSCYTGIYMENIAQSMAEFVGLEGHASKYLNDDPHYPCNIVDQKHKPECYFLQSDRMVQLFGGDFSKVAQTCSEVEDLHSRRLCFESMGRTNSSYNRGNPVNAIANCGFADTQEEQRWCIRGTVQDTFWDPTGQDIAISFCKKTSELTLKSACYGTIFERALEVLEPKNLAQFCAKVESSYQNTCPQ